MGSVLSPTLHVATWVCRGHPHGRCWKAFECTGLNPGVLAGPTPVLAPAPAPTVSRKSLNCPG